MTIKKGHSTLGASSAYRWMNCLGSVRLAASCPKPPASKYAEEGTAAHELAELVLSKTPNAQYYLLGKHKFNGFEVTEEMADCVQHYADYVQNIRRKLKGKLIVEQRIHLKSLHPDLWGTSDAVVYQEFGELHVFDFKYGAGITVEVEENEQIMYYALGVIEALDHDDFSSVTLHVCQPRADHEDGAFRSWKTTVGDLREFGKLLRTRALQTQKKDAPLKSGAWCQFCPAAGVCPELHKTAVEVARTDFQSPKLPAVEALTIDQVKKIVEHKALITSWLNAVEDHAYNALMNGQKIPGLKLVKRRARREWIDEQKAQKALVSKLGNDAFTRKLLSVPQAEKALGKDFVNGLFESVSTGLAIAPESDKRPAVTAAQDDFEAIDETISGDDF